MISLPLSLPFLFLLKRQIDGHPIDPPPQVVWVGEGICFYFHPELGRNGHAMQMAILYDVLYFLS